jgi:lipopolysaccharide export system protein LptA
VKAWLVLAVGALALGPAVAGAQPRATPPRGGQTPARGATPGKPVTVDADKMERFGKEGLVVFTGNVVARQDSSVQHADRMEVYLDEKGNRIVRTVSVGNVRIVTRDCRTGTARRAEYLDLEQRVVLSGDARVWQGDNIVTGETITIYLSQDRSVVQAGQNERVKAVFYPRDEAQGEGAAKPRAAAASTDGCGD